MRRIIGHIIFVILSFLFCILYDQYAPFILFLFLLIYPMINLFILLHNRKRLSMRWRLKRNTIKKGQAVKIIFKFKNKSRIFPVKKGRIYFATKNFYTGEIVKYNYKFSMEAMVENEITISLPMTHCGSIQIECQEVKIYDYFSWFYVRFLKNKNNAANLVKQLYVLPKMQLMEVSKETINMENDFETVNYSKDQRGDDPTEIFDIREYEEGDKMQQIHWKLTASRNSYMVKEYSMPIYCSKTIVVDMFAEKRNSEESKEVRDALLTLLYSSSFSLLESNQLHYICWFEQETSECRRKLIQKDEDIVEVLQELLVLKQTYPMEHLCSSYAEKFRNEKMGKVYFISNRDEYDLNHLEVCFLTEEVQLYKPAIMKGRKAMSGEDMLEQKSSRYEINVEDIESELLNLVL